MEMANKAQITKLHVLLTKLGLLDDKKAIVRNASNNRTSSSKELTMSEAKRLISVLCDSDPAERLKTIISQLAYQAGITYGSTETDRILNKVKIDMFLHKNGAVKQDLQKQTYAELVKTHRQFEAIVKGVAKSKDLRTADKLVHGLLNELDFVTTKNVKP